MDTRPRILIVDDEPFNLDYLEQELEESGYLISVAANGQEALDKIDSDGPDLVLLDIMMPVIDGFEVLARLKANPGTRELPVIVISASTDLPSVVRGIELGAEDYLPKPFQPTLLNARISSSLEKKRLRDLRQLYLRSLERELEIARDIQSSFLPSELPDVEGWEIATYFQSAREVAGDFYDAFLLPDGNLACTIGDVCGKGVGAALFMTLFRSLIRVTATTGLSLAAPAVPQLTVAERLKLAVAFTNDYVAATHAAANMFATLFIGVIDVENGTLTYINGGNEPPLLLKHGGSRITLAPTGMSIGIVHGAAFDVKVIPMDQGDLLLAFTDGVPDALNAGEECFGYSRLFELLRYVEPGAAAMVEAVAESLRQFTGGAEQFDDITIVAVRRRPDW